jgi:hypothetical protein
MAKAPKAPVAPPVAPTLGTDTAPPPPVAPDTGNGPSPSTAAIQPQGGQVDDGGQPMGVDPHTGGPAPVEGESRPDVVPSLEVANAPGIGNAVAGSTPNPLDHDGDGKSGGAIPSGATRDYQRLMADEAVAVRERDELKAKLAEVEQQLDDVTKQLAEARTPGAGSSLADQVADKVVARLGGGSNVNASGAPNRPPQHIDDLRTPGIND